MGEIPISAQFWVLVLLISWIISVHRCVERSENLNVE